MRAQSGMARCLKSVKDGHEARSRLALCTIMFFILPPQPRFKAGRRGADAEGAAMRLFKLTRINRYAALLAALIALTAVRPAAAQTSIKFSLDGRLEGLAA